MNILKGIKRLRDSLRTETNPDIVLTTRAVLSGMVNYYKGVKSDTIKQNAYVCKDCEHNVLETDEDFKLEDKEFPFLSNRMCGDCGGCSLSFKTRQNVKPCRLWEH